MTDAQAAVVVDAADECSRQLGYLVHAVNDLRSAIYVIGGELRYELKELRADLDKIDETLEDTARHAPPS